MAEKVPVKVAKKPRAAKKAERGTRYECTERGIVVAVDAQKTKAQEGAQYCCADCGLVLTIDQAGACESVDCLVCKKPMELKK